MFTLEEAIRRIVREEIAGQTGDVRTYDTRRLPPDVRTKVTFHKIVCHVPGARKVGRTWVVEAEAWRAFRAGGGQTSPVDPDAPEAVAARMMADSHRAAS